MVASGGASDWVISGWLAGATLSVAAESNSAVGVDVVSSAVLAVSGGGGGAGRFRITPNSDFAFWPKDSGGPEGFSDGELSAMEAKLAADQGHFKERRV